ncbi:MAG: phosphoribosylformylglycinamidine synthase subunit PurQ [Helicobacteraceae bacterium]|jgi:phosphoribosylformylglycinamidine synthase|nr:phosphoribosylformylglycinamidine synthase subunit PurQ [Helicobacteraceae bacterium]
MIVSILSFPGSNCERDTKRAFERAGAKCVVTRRDETELPQKTDLVVAPGGFSYGDYLRCGAIARFAPIMSAVAAFAKNGGRVLGVCNGFQILLEAGLLPGAMLRNKNLRFISRDVFVKVVSAKNSFLSNFKESQIISMPIAHAEGAYYIDPDGLKGLYDNDQVALTYCDQEGADANVNGAIDHIAGVFNKEKNVFALMPHPERAASAFNPNNDGLALIKNALEF